MASIDQLKALVSSKAGLARSNSFLVELPNLDGSNTSFLQGVLSRFTPAIPGLPNIFGGGTPNSSDLNILCKNVSMPGKQVLTVERQIGMKFEKMAYGYAVDDVAMTFYLLNDYGVMNYFNQWRSLILNEETGTVNYKNQYAKSVKIHQLSKPLVGLSKSFGPVRVNVGLGSGSIYSVSLNEAFPTTINAIDFSNELDGLVECTVQLSYTNWTTNSSSQNFLNFDINPGQLFG